MSPHWLKVNTTLPFSRVNARVPGNPIVQLLHNFSCCILNKIIITFTGDGISSASHLLISLQLTPPYRFYYPPLYLFTVHLTSVATSRQDDYSPGGQQSKPFGCEARRSQTESSPSPFLLPIPQPPWPHDRRPRHPPRMLRSSLLRRDAPSLAAVSVGKLQCKSNYKSNRIC